MQIPDGLPTPPLWYSKRKSQWVSLTIDYLNGKIFTLVFVIKGYEGNILVTKTFTHAFIKIKPIKELL